MDLNDLTIGQAKELAALLNCTTQIKETSRKASDVGNYVIVRTYSAGAFAGYLENRSGQEVVLSRARRLWYWSGATSLSQLAMEGVKKPDNCKFPCEVESITLTQGIEIIKATEKARLSIAEVPIWKQ